MIAGCRAPEELGRGLQTLPDCLDWFVLGLQGLPVVLLRQASERNPQKAPGQIAWQVPGQRLLKAQLSKSQKMLDPIANKNHRTLTYTLPAKRFKGQSTGHAIQQNQSPCIRPPNERG